MKQKLYSNSGETIVEALASVLIVAVCFLMLQNAIVTSANLNDTASIKNITFKESEKKEDTSCTVKVNDTIVTNMKCYETGDYYYYE